MYGIEVVIYLDCVCGGEGLLLEWLGDAIRESIVW